MMKRTVENQFYVPGYSTTINPGCVALLYIHNYMQHMRCLLKVMNSL